LLSSSLSGDHPSCLLPSQLLLQQILQLLRYTLHQQTAAALDSQGPLSSWLLLQLLRKVAWCHLRLQLLQQRQLQQRSATQMQQVMPVPAFLQQEQTAQEPKAQKAASLLLRLLQHHLAAVAASPRCLQPLQLPLQPQLAVAAAVMRCWLLLALLASLTAALAGALADRPALDLPCPRACRKQPGACTQRHFST
jgi:hypothetical protein